MGTWMQIIDIGHTSVMIPLAGAIAAWLALHGRWKLVLWWCALFGGGLVLVACSKIVFLGWGLDIPPLRFQALSGHAYRATTVIPVLVFLMLRRAPRGWRRAGIALGFAASIGLGGLLVMFGYHTISEVVASVMLGAVAAVTFIGRADATPAWAGNRWAVPLALVALVVTGALKPASLNPRLIDVALYLSGRDHTYRWVSSRDPNRHPGRHSFPVSKDKIMTECRVHLPHQAHRE